MINRAFYTSKVRSFLNTDIMSISGKISASHTQVLQHQQSRAWGAEINVLKKELSSCVDDNAYIFFEFMIPRMGRRADVVLVFKGVIFVIEFKVGAQKVNRADLRQAHGYALDLKNFHSGSHDKHIVPILIATELDEPNSNPEIFKAEFASDDVANPFAIHSSQLFKVINQITESLGNKSIDAIQWAASGYRPTPTIIEAAQALYAQHKVEDIAKSEADTKNLGQTSQQLLQLIHDARKEKRKIICFVTGVPGAGKTLVGLNIASTHSNPDEKEYSVFLSGNGPLVSVLQEALARDRKERTGDTLSSSRRQTEQFIQNIHKFRDDSLSGDTPPEQVAIFDEAQRAWNKEQTSKFMQTKRNQVGFDKSEPEYLIEVMDRHCDWAVIIALIGGGQEINTGEVGLLGWLEALDDKFNHWDAYYSTDLLHGEYISSELTAEHFAKGTMLPCLHLATSMRSFRAEKLSSFVHHLVNGQSQLAREMLATFSHLYPIKVTRSLATAKNWMKSKSRGTESIGMLASSNAIRLKAEGIFVKNTIEPKDWFLGQPEDIRSCHFLEDIATEFDIQGLELDWSLVAWDGDFRFNPEGKEHWRFRGTKWEKRQQRQTQIYLENAYRVLLTRARQGVVIFVPNGDDLDKTRQREFYDGTFNFLKSCGIEVI